MKPLPIEALRRADSLYLDFDGTYDASAKVEHAVEPFLQVLEQYAGHWMPSHVKGKRWRTFSRAAFWAALQDRPERNVATVYLERASDPSISGEIALFRKETPGKVTITLRAQPFAFFAHAERCQELVELVRAWASHYPVSHACAGSYADSQLADSPCFGRAMHTTVENGFDQLYEVFWLNVFGPRLVNQLGRERLLSTPAHRVEELPNGCVLLVTHPSVTDFTQPEARKAQARAFVHLRPELDFDTVLRSLHERDAALVPVEPRFPPDVAPLLLGLLDRTFIGERQRKIAEFNAHPFPEPEEWLPADAALPSDVPDMQKALEHHSLMAETLVAILHSEVPSVLEQTPESLTDADLDFWTWNFPERFERNQIDGRLVPAIGAYLGEVMVKHLGGQWIPRRKLEESQVRVGSRMWLPFVRAHKCMRSSQSLLDFSLTQLYRAAERHRG